MRVGWNFENKLERTAASTDFSEFVTRVVTNFPGWMSKAYENYIGPEDAPFVDFVGKQETLRLDLLLALRTAGQPVNADVILNLNLINQASILPEWREACAYTPALKEAVMHSERKAMKRFGYW